MRFRPGRSLTAANSQTALQYVQSGNFDIDELPRPITVVGVNQVLGRLERRKHWHRKCKLLYSIRGALTCEIEGSLWTATPQCAVWIPSSTPHKCHALGHAEYYMLLIDSDIGVTLPQSCCTMAVSALLREMLIRAAQFPALYPLDGPEVRLLPVILDELSAARTEDHRIPLPTDPSLRRLLEMMMSAPEDKASAAEWAARCALSERTLNRKLRRETGMSLWRWRHQIHVMLAVQRMSNGESVQAVAMDLGYESASSFISMFKKTIGKPPARYLAERDSQR